MGKSSIENYLDLEDKIAIITGAATGLGAATAELFSQMGVKILINHLPGQESDAQAVERKCSSDSFCFAADITQNEPCENLVRAAIDKWGKVDILVNNAGINMPVEHYDLEGLDAMDFRSIFNVNVIGAYQMIRAVVPSMRSSGKGAIINISSTAGESGYGSSVAYAASKGAMNTMTKSLGRVLGPEIRINAVCPGYMDTPLWDDKPKLSEQVDEAVNSTPLQLDAKPEYVARSILFLASGLSNYLTGQLLVADGGVSLGAYQQLFENNDD